MQLCARADFADMRTFLIEHAQFIYDWLVAMEARATPVPEATGDTVPTGVISQNHVAAAFENMTVLYESRIQTIPLTLLAKFQNKVFGSP
mgnify:CR=1 FL=1